MSAAAPGAYLPAAYPERHVAGSDADAYFQLSGTSMAAAEVSGAVALLLERGARLSPAETRAVLQVTSTFVPEAGLMGAGAGSVNALAAAGLLFGPLVGALIGLAGGLTYTLALGLGLPPWPAAALALATSIGATGALHEDGLADVADGLGGGRTRADKLRIMRDPRIGSYGTIALVLALLARAGALVALADPSAVVATLVTAGAVSRAALPAVMASLPLARSDGLAAQTGRPHPLRAAAAVLIAVLTAAALLGQGAPAALLGGAVGAWIASRRMRRPTS